MIFPQDRELAGKQRGTAARQIHARSETETISSSLWQLEHADWGTDPDHEAELAALAERSGGRNLFFEPVLVKAAKGRIFSGNPHELTLFEKLGSERRAKLHIPLVFEKAGWPPMPVFRAASHPFAPLSLPLADFSDRDEAIERFAQLLPHLTLCTPLLFEDFPVDNPLAARFLAKVQSHGSHVAAFAASSRAVLHFDPRHNEGVPSWLNAKRKRETARLLRKIGELGHVEFEKAASFWDVMVRFEEFLVLETRGWKGRKGSSIHILRKTAAFARQAVADLAMKGRAVIYSMRLDDKPVASLIMLQSGGCYYPWKIAVDENYRNFAPGVELMLRASRSVMMAPDFVQADSLAKEDSWVDRLWQDQIRLASVVIAPDEKTLEATVSAILRRETARRMAKRLLGRGRFTAPARIPFAPVPGIPAE